MKPLWLDEKGKESRDIIQPNREAQAHVIVPDAALVTDAVLPPARVPVAKDRIGRISITKRDRRDEQEHLATCGGFQPEDDGIEPVRRTFRIDYELNAFLETNCDGNLNGYVQGLLVYAVEELLKQNQVIQVAFVNDDGTPAKRKRTKKNKETADGSAAVSSPTGPNQNTDGGEA
jgi:hypothetical protein